MTRPARRPQPVPLWWGWRVVLVVLALTGGCAVRWGLTRPVDGWGVLALLLGFAAVVVGFSFATERRVR